MDARGKRSDSLSPCAMDILLVSQGLLQYNWGTGKRKHPQVDRMHYFMSQPWKLVGGCGTTAARGVIISFISAIFRSLLSPRPHEWCGLRQRILSLSVRIFSDFVSRASEQFRFRWENSTRLISVNLTASLETRWTRRKGWQSSGDEESLHFIGSWFLCLPLPRRHKSIPKWSRAFEKRCRQNCARGSYESTS